MHDIEPYFQWRDRYIASEDSKSPFYNRVYDEFKFSQKVYNYYIHPQWDSFGSQTLYMKILFVDYEGGYAIFEMMGEWNDAIGNDIMFLKREIVDDLAQHGIHKFILMCENVLNFHGDQEDYYEEWYEDVREEDGWICLMNTLDHVENEMRENKIHYYVNLGPAYNQLNWRTMKPKVFYAAVERMVQGDVSGLLK